MERSVLVRRFYEEIDKGNIAIINEMVARDYVDHSPSPCFPASFDGVKQSFELFPTATPGYHRIDEMIAEGDKVVTKLTSYGKHEGDLPGAPRTGIEMKVTSITIHPIANGKPVEKWSEKDRIVTQIGVAPPIRKGKNNRHSECNLMW